MKRYSRFIKKKYPAPKRKFAQVTPQRPSILQKEVETNEILKRIIKTCDEAKNNKNG